jgi:hypothetical protein
MGDSFQALFVKCISSTFVAKGKKIFIKITQYEHFLIDFRHYFFFLIFKSQFLGHKVRVEDFILWLHILPHNK